MALPHNEAPESSARDPAGPRADCPHVVCATLPLRVDPNSSRARWSKRHQQLTVRLENAELMEELGMDQYLLIPINTY
jgi:hypothetical protein